MPSKYAKKKKFVEQTQSPDRDSGNWEPTYEEGLPKLDLHGLYPEEIANPIHSFLFEAWQRGDREVHIVHGIGQNPKAPLRTAVLAYLASGECDAMVKDFGEVPNVPGRTRVELEEYE